MILSIVAGSGSAALALAARLGRVRTELRVRSLAHAGVTSWMVGAAVSMLLGQVWPGKPYLILSITTLAAWAWDFTSDEAKAALRQQIMDAIKRAIEAVIRGDKR